MIFPEFTVGTDILPTNFSLFLGRIDRIGSPLLQTDFRRKTAESWQHHL
jgi:hypothetical protein